MWPKEILSLAIIGWIDYLDENLIEAIALMSKNIDEVVYPIVDATPTYYISPLKFDFFDRPVLFSYIQEWARPNLFYHIENDILSKANGVLISFGGDTVNLLRTQGEKLEDNPDFWNLSRIVDLAKQSGRPIVYGLDYDGDSLEPVNLLKKVLKLGEADLIMTYSYFQPGTLKRILHKLIEISLQPSGGITE